MVKMTVSYEMHEGYNNQRPSLDLEDLALEYDQVKATEFAPGPEHCEVDSDRNFKHKIIDSQSKRTCSTSLPSGTVTEYVEDEVTLKEYYYHNIRDSLTLDSIKEYILSIFPIIRWIPHYNLAWGYADLVAGITIGCVLVPQSMSYAQIATLPPQYGLYSSFIGAFIYSLFATSKDVCIGPVAVMSLETAKVIERVMDKYPADSEITAPIIATALALLCGIIAAGLGILRLGFLVEFISLNAVAGFMTGSAFNILWGQVPGLMGYSSKVNTRESTYKVVINTLKHLPDTKLDAVFGLIPLVILYTWKWWCSSMGPKLADRHYATNSKQNKYLKLFYFYGQAMRNAIVIIVFTAISWSITREKTKAQRPISVLGTVPSGLDNVGIAKVPAGLLSSIAPELPAAVIVLLLEHIAIAKSFGRINNYKIVPDQEIIAIGVTNLIGTFFNAYPATGSFSRSALKAKCNVRTPFSGVFTGSCVLLALYCLTSAFFYIPKATLSAVIIHAVSDLIASYKTTWNFWKMNPLDCVCFIVTVFITVFSSIENGIYFAMCWSCAILLLKVAFPAGKFLGRVEITEIINPTLSVADSTSLDYSTEEIQYESNILGKGFTNFNKAEVTSSKLDSNIRYYTKWVPFDHSYTRELNSEVVILPPPPGVIVYRLSDSFTYINCSKHFDVILEKIKETTRKGKIVHNQKKSDRPWNDPGRFEWPSIRIPWFTKNKPETNIEVNDRIATDNRPILKIVCLDFSQVSQADSTALQSLVDLRKSINNYADRQVEFHFAGIISPWIKKGLISMGFGTVNEEYSDESIIMGHRSYHVARFPEGDNDTDFTTPDDSIDIEFNASNHESYGCRVATGTNLPFFHIDIPDFSKWGL